MTPSTYVPPQNWHVHIGTVQLFLVGTGPNAWLACSQPCYRGQVGTDAERDIARRACQILNRIHGTNKDAGPDEISAALLLAASSAGEIPKPEIIEPPVQKPQPVKTPDPKPINRQVPPAAALVQQSAVRIHAAIESVCQITHKQMLTPTQNRWVRQARMIGAALLHQEFPEIPRSELDVHFWPRATGQAWHAIQRHKERITSNRAYAALFDRCLAAIAQPLATAS